MVTHWYAHKITVAISSKTLVPKSTLSHSKILN